MKSWAQLAKETDDPELKEHFMSLNAIYEKDKRKRATRKAAQKERLANRTAFPQYDWDGMSECPPREW